MKLHNAIPKTAALALLMAAAGLAHFYSQNNTPPQLGVVDGQLKPLGDKPNDVSSQTEISAKYVPPLPFKDSPEATMAALKSAVATYGEGRIVEETDDYLYVVFTTPWLKFHDDVEFWLDGAGEEVQFRSASRAGYSDMGLNRRRYETLSGLYRAR